MTWLKGWLVSVFGMSKLQAGLLAMVGLIGGTLAHLLGGWDTAVAVLVLLMAVDFLSGCILAGVFKRSGKSESGAYDSKAGYKGIMKKVTILLAVMACAAFDRFLGEAAFVRDAVVIAWIFNEFWSFVENTALMGVKWPSAVLNALEQVKTSKLGKQDEA